jgi:WG containing repeat
MEINPESTALTTAPSHSPALMRVSGQLSVTEKLLAKVDDLLLLPYRKGDKWGFCDRNGIIKIACNYDAVGYFGENKLAMFKDWNYCGLLNKTGLVVVPVIYKKIGYFSEGLCIVWGQNGLAGFVNETGKLIIKCEFLIEDYSVKEASFHEGLVKIKKDGLYGFLNKKGEVVLPFKYSSAGHFSNGLAPVSEYIQVDEYNYEFVYGYIDQKGEYLFDGFSSAEEFSDGWAVINRDFYISLDGKNLYGSGFTEVNSFRDGMGRVRGANWGSRYSINIIGGISKWGFIDKSGYLAIEFIYEDAKDFSEGMAPVKLNGKWGFINKSNEVVISFKYDDAEIFQDGLAAVEEDSKWGVIDNLGNQIVRSRYNAHKCRLINIGKGFFELLPHNDEIFGYVSKGKNIYFGKSDLDELVDLMRFLHKARRRPEFLAFPEEEWVELMIQWMDRNATDIPTLVKKYKMMLDQNINTVKIIKMLLRGNSTINEIAEFCITTPEFVADIQHRLIKSK